MLLFFQGMIILLATLENQAVNAQKCKTGWFGENCMYRCSCKNSQECDHSGKCQDDVCVAGYFGPGCQYHDLAVFDPGHTEMYLYDHDDKTCNPNHAATSLHVTMLVSWPVMWFRIGVKDLKHIHNFTTTINVGERCTNERRFFGNLFIDVTCDFRQLVKAVVIEGPVVPDVCSMHLTNGRLVSHLQMASQSSNSTSMAAFAASLAVDGNSSTLPAGHTCSNTRPEHNPVWELRYNRPQILSYIQIHSNDGATGFLYGFNLEGFDHNGSRLYLALNTAYSPGLSYDIRLTSRYIISHIKIGMRKMFSHARVLSLCEVETFGETACPVGTYGLWCSEKCQCNDTEICNVVTGLCAPGCAPGFYGFNCSMHCSSHCVNLSCDSLEGFCFECHPGFSGDYCSDACRPDHYGPRCTLKCSEHCLHKKCEAVSGNCSCVELHVGPRCTECPDGFFGLNCSNKCPSVCAGKICDANSSACLACEPQRFGRFCENCSEKYYGPDCDLQCSAFCKNLLCDSRSGRCSSCNEGYTGELCTIPPTNLFSTADAGSEKVVPAMLGLIVMVSGVLLFCVKKEEEPRKLVVQKEGAGKTKK